MPKAGGEDTEEELEDNDTSQVYHKLRLDCDALGLHAPRDRLTSAIPRLKEDVEALMRLSNFELSPLRVVRPVQVVQVFYGFGDALGKQFGSTLSENLNCRGRFSSPGTEPGGVRFRIGLWSAAEEEESSTNFKELKNRSTPFEKRP